MKKFSFVTLASFKALVLAIAFCFAIVNSAFAARTAAYTFDDSANLLKASVGTDAIAYSHKLTPETGNGNLYSATSASVLENAHGGALAIPMDAFLAVPHGLTDGTQWCLKMRIFIPTGNLWYSLFSLTQDNDGDGWMFVKNNSEGQFGGGVGGFAYKATTAGGGIFGKWSTVVLSVDSTSSCQLYVNGEYLGASSKTSEYSLDGKNYIFIGADNDHEDNLFYVDYVEVYDEARPAEVFATDKFTDHLPTGPQTWRGVPSDYAQVEYIRSSSAQLIDTGVIPGPTVAVDFNFGDVVYAQNTAFFGQNWNVNQYLFNQQSTKFMFHSSGNNLDSPVLANTDYRCQVDTNGTLYLAHESTVNTYPGMTLTAATDQKMAVFGCINGNNFATFTLYGMKIYRNDILAADLVPVIRVSDEKPGLYDLVEAKFLVNTKSAADFTYGEKLKKPKENPTFVSTGAQVFEIEGMDAECYYWSDATTPGTITIPEGGAMFDVLLVGGGGAGGLCRGGGGGGGGVVYQVGQTLPAGTYTVTVGAGGVPQVMGSGEAHKQGKSPATTCGGNSTITLASSEVFVAHGGGGGGNFTYQSGADVENCKGYDGASGGGAGGHNEVAIPGGAGIEGEGYAGGAQPSTYTGGGGGGGAGAIGMPTSALASGNGGDGLTIGITGVDVVYGGGGGGGGYLIPEGEGGAGGGGNGNYDQKQSADSGKNGLGGGGGGGGGKENKAEYMGGGAGGSGVVILRYSPPSAEPRISNFAVKSANYTNVEFSVAVSALGTGKTSATATVEIANDDDFDDIVTNKVKNLTGPWSENAYSLEISPIATTRYARLIVDNGEFATTSEVVTVSQEHAFVLSGCGYEYKNGGLEISALVSSLAAPSVTIALYVNDAVSPSVTTNVTAAENVVMMLPGISTATNIRAELTAVGKSETQNIAVKPGSSQKVVADPSAHATGVNAVVVKAGDSVVFPSGDYTYECVDSDRFITIDGNLVTTKDAGILAITQYDAQQVEGPSVVLIIEPSDKAPNARTFIWDESASKAWNNPTGWKQVGVEVNEDYPNAATDLVFIPITAAKTLSVTGTNTVQDLYIGYLKTASIDCFRLQGGSASGNALKIVGVRTEGAERPGRFGILSSTVNEAVLTVRLGGNDANHYLAFIADTDLDVDFGGPLGTLYGPTSRHRYTKMYCSNTHLEIAEGVTVQYVNGQNHPTGVDMQGGWYEFCTDFLRGTGTFRMAMAGVFSMWSNHFRAFEGTVVNSIRNNISQTSSSRGGNIYSCSYNSSSILRLEGFITKGFSISESVGTFIQGSAHGYGGADTMPLNGLSDTEVVLAGGYMRFINWNKTKSNFWLRQDGDYEAHNFTDKLTIDAGYSHLESTADPGSGNPIQHFCASNLVHKNSGTLYIIDGRTAANTTTRREMIELRGLSDHFVGYTGAADLENNVFPIVPWIVTRCGSNVKPDLWWAYTDADSYMCRPGTRTSVTLNDVTDPNRNVYSSGKSLALTADKTVNSLSLSNSGKEYKLGEGVTLTITSGGLIFNENGSSIGAVSGGDLNGTVEFPNRAYVYATSDSESNPNQIWSKVVAPNGFVVAHTGYFILGGDQTGIDGDITLNNGTTWLGAKDGSGTVAVDVPIKLVGGNTKLALTRAGVLGDINLYLQSAGDYSPKVEILAGVTETCNKLFVDGVTLPHGIYGATGSGAEIIDDEHFSGTGTLEVLYDELGTPILNDLTTTLVRELDASFTVTAAKGGGATTCDLYSLATKVSDGSVLTNLFASITEDVTDFPFVVSNLEDGVDYDISVLARNTKVMSGETYHFEAKIGPNRIHTYAIDYTPELSVDASEIVPTASTATIPWHLRTKGYQCELVSLKVLYGFTAEALTQEKTLDPDVELGDNVAYLDGLLAKHEYFAKIVAVNNKGDGWQGETAVFSFTNLSAAAVSGDGNEIKIVGDDQIAMFANNGTIKIPEPMTARVLLVGGGGAGGRWQGGGGAGGQVVEITELSLTPGEYTINVGAGGIPTDTSDQKRDYSLGGTSSIVQNDIILAQAKGGGQGGNYCNTESVRNGSDGANGGGASYGDNSSKTGKGGSPTVKNGYTGGASYDGTSANNYTTGGGAGAGEDGQNGYCELNSGLYYGHGGNGGRGLASDITGENVVYGGGGGGGVYSRDNQYAGSGLTTIATPGKGGEGGGGQGAGGNISIGTYQWATAGVDGLGGGGGGGARYNGSTSFDTNYFGTAGGKGTVIIRFSNTEREPRVSANATRADLDCAEVAVKLDYAGVEKNAADIYFACGTDSAALLPTLVQSALAQGATYTYALANPTAATTYYYKAFASNAWGRVSAVIGGSFTIGGIAAGTGGTVTRQGDYVIQTFNANGQLTLPNNVEADVLVLAGGGAGGYNRAGGGGAGGLIYGRGVKLAAGSYEVTVGAGGTPTSANTAGGNGGDSVLAYASDELFRAVGGGGGGNYNQGDTAAYGNAGGSSGGNARRTITPMNAVAGQGHMGGLATYGNDWNGGGGGGAGGRGWEGVYEPANNIKRGGNGGVGVELDISGAFRWYAGGGGGGFYNKKGDGNWIYTEGGLGGLGGGGKGAGGNGETSSSAYAFNAAEAGTDGLGGGGGGGSHGESSSAPAGGGAGGKGVVIVRYYAPEGGEIGSAPVVEIREAKGNDNATITLGWKVVTAGANATSCTLTARYGVATNVLTKVVQIAANASGEGTATLKGVKPGTAYYVQLEATNDRSVTASASSLAKVEIPNLIEYTTTRLGGADGFLQAQFADNNRNWYDSLQANDSLRRELGAVMGYIQGVPGKSGTWQYTSPIDGIMSEWASLTTFGYQGYIYLNEGALMRFGTAIDDYSLLKINGETLWDVRDCSFNIITYFYAEKTGWYPIEVRFGNDRNTAGRGTSGDLQYTGFGYSGALVGYKGNRAWAWYQPMEDGVAKMFSTGPAGRGFDAFKVSDQDGLFKASLVSSTSTSTSDLLYACYGEAAAGDVIANWDHSEVIATLGTNVETNEYSVELTDDQAFVRFATVDSSGNVAWSKTFVRDVFKAPKISEVHIAENLGDTLVFAGSLEDSGDTNVVMTLHYGTARNDRSGYIAMTTHPDEDGTFSIEVTGLACNTRYYYYWTAEAPGGGSDEQSVNETIVTAGSPVFSVWYDTRNQRLLQVHVEVTSVGAGGQVALSLGIRKYDRKGSAAYTYVDAMTVTEPGEYILEWNGANETVFGEFMNYRVNLKNEAGSTKFENNSDGTFVFEDRLTYTWTGLGGDGKWNNPGNWSEATGATDTYGYPAFMSDVIFPAGCNAEVILTEPKLNIHSLVFAGGSSGSESASSSLVPRRRLFTFRGECTVTSSRMVMSPLTTMCS